jgi:UDP-N-acetylglucosamine transferase subunit ALG13
MIDTIREARVIVTHAGVGSVMVALANSKRPIVVPRRRSFGEAVDDHQLQLGRRFADAGLVTLVETPDGLGNALMHEQGPATLVPASSSLATDLRTFVEAALMRTSTSARA